MAFWNREELPLELKDKKPEEIVAALKEADTRKAAAEAAEAAKTTAEQAAETSKQEAEQLRARVADLEKNQKTPDSTPLPDEPASPWVDPERFVQEQTRGVAAVALQSGRLTAQMYFVQGLTSRDQKIFRKFEKEVGEVVSTFQASAQVMPQSWLNAFMFVKGKHEQDIHKAESESSDFFSETASRGAHEEPPPEDKLTSAEEETCRTFHFDPVGYLANKKTAALKQSEKGAYASYPVPTPTNRD